MACKLELGGGERVLEANYQCREVFFKLSVKFASQDRSSRALGLQYALVRNFLCRDYDAVLLLTASWLVREGASSEEGRAWR